MGLVPKLVDIQIYANRLLIGGIRSPTASQQTKRQLTNGQ
jgi:hypothetical protein